ncbi:MAG TPA: UDP-glucose 4-epimerase GalE [Microbacteriaceae bacterium]|nr:UDP-glucose 4-epimerase GalE [Microbacteriaceae bacterium]
MAILVVGGAGYIGSHTVRELEKAGQEVWVFDDLSLGHAQSVRSDRLIRGELLNRSALDEALRGRSIDAVMHFAAFTSVPESVADPARYYRNNVVGTLNLLDAMRDAGVRRIVFSSTAAVYGVPDVVPIAEDAPTRPINPYGVTKLTIERALADYAHAYGFGYTVLRYFNACGASSDATIGEDHTPETHLIPIILQVALGQRESVSVFGTDYPTPDGTCIRDYIHVADIADAHVAAALALAAGPGGAADPLPAVINLGSGAGSSVREIMRAVADVTGIAFEPEVAPRRAGDPARIVAGAGLAGSALGWSARRGLREMVASGWAAHRGVSQGAEGR